MVQRDEQERKERSRMMIDDAGSSVPVPSTTTTTTRIILVSEAEYAANVVAACQWARDHDDHWMVLAIPSSTSSLSFDDDSMNSTGIVDLQVFDSMLEGNFRYKNKSGEAVRLDPSSIAIICITHVPTNSGIVNPVEAIGERISTYNNNKQRQRKVEQREGGAGGSYYCGSIKYLVDACQSVGQMDVNVQKIKCDSLVATG